MSVQLTKDSLVLETVTVTTDGMHAKGRQFFSLDGKPSSIVSNVSKRKITRTYGLSADKQTITLTTAFYMLDNENEVDFTRVEKWTMENGLLTIQKKSIETRSETWEVKGGFEKMK